MKHSAQFVLSIAVIVFLAACSGTDPTPTNTSVPPAPAAASTTSVRVFLVNDHSLQRMNFWVALGAGLFEDEGLDVQVVLPSTEGGGGGVAGGSQVRATRNE